MHAGSSESETGPEPGPKPKPRWRVWLRRGALGLVALLVLLITFVVSVLWIPALSRATLATLLGRWDRGVPATIEWSAIEGSFAGGLVIHDLELRDSEGELLLALEQGELDLDPLALFSREARLEQLALRGLDVHTEHRWRDLAGPPKPKQEPKPKQAGHGPDLPVHVIAALELERLHVYGEAGELLSLDAFHLGLEGEGRSASLSLGLETLSSPKAPAPLERAALRVTWLEPELRVELLELDSPVATLRLPEPAALDASTLAAGLALDLDLVVEPLAEFASLDETLPKAQLPARVGVELRGRGRGSSAHATLELDLDTGGALSLAAAGRRDTELGAWSVLAGLEATLNPALVDPRQPGIELELRARARRASTDAPIDALVALRVRERGHEDALVARAEARSPSFEPLAGSAALELRGLGLDLRAHASHASPEPASPTTAELRLALAELHTPIARALPFIEAFVDPAQLDAVRGGVYVEAHCGPATELSALRCEPRVRVTEFEGFGNTLASAELSGSVEPLADEPLFDLDLRAAGLVVADGGYALQTIEASAEGKPSDLHLEAEGAGKRDSFDIALDLEQGPSGRALRFERLRASTSRTKGLSAIELRAPGALVIHEDRVEVEALDLRAFGADIDAEGTFALTPERSHDLRLSVSRLDLRRLDRALPGPSMRGRVDLEVRLQGPQSDPHGRVELRGRDLILAGLELGDLDLDLDRGASVGPSPRTPIEPAFVALAPGASARRPRPGDLRVDLLLAGPLARRLELHSSLPVSGARLGPGPIDLSLAVEDFALHELAALMPETPPGWDPTGPSAAPPGQPLLVPEGRIDLDLVASGTSARPELELALRAAHLELDRAELGSVQLRAHVDRKTLGIELDLDPSFLDGVTLRAEIPIELDLRRGRAMWAKTREHALSLDVSGLDPEVLARELGPSIPALGFVLSALPLTGEFATGVRIRGTPDEPELDLRIHGRELALGPTKLGRGRIDLGYADDMARAEFELASPLVAGLDGWVEVPIHLDPLAAEPVSVEREAPLDGAIHAHGLDLGAIAALAGVELGGEGELELAIGGVLARPEAKAEIEVAALATGRGEIGDIRASLVFEPSHLDLDLDLVRAGVHSLALRTRIPLETELFPPEGEKPRVTWRPSGSHRIQLATEAIDEALLAALVPLPPDLRFDGALSLEGGGELDDFELDGEVHALVARGQDDDELTPILLGSTIHLDETRQTLELELEPGEGPSLSASLGLALPVAPYLAGEHELADTRYTLVVEAPQFELANLASFVPTSLHDPVGLLDANFRGEGRLGAPDLAGTIVVRDAALTVVPLRQRVRAIELELELSQDHAKLVGLSLAAGKGGIEGQGRVDLVDVGLDAKLDLDIRDFPFVQPGLPPITLNTGASFEVRTKPGDLDIHLALSEPEITVGATPKSATKAIPTSDAIVFVDAGARAEGSEDADLPELDESEDRLALKLELLDPLRIAGNPIDVAWTGTVALERVDGQLRATGQLDTRRGRIDLVGKQFDIQRGSVALTPDGALDPYIELLATTQVGDAEISATIRGRVSRPELIFSSSAGHSQYEIFSLLVTGTVSPSDAERSSLEAQAASLLAAVSSPQLQQKIQQTLGIDRAKLGFGDTIDQPILTVGKRVSRRVYLETHYHHNAPDDANTAEVRVQYDFARRWSLQTHFGDAAVGGVGTYWSRTLAAPKWKRQPESSEGDDENESGDSKDTEVEGPIGGASDPEVE